MPLRHRCAAADDGCVATCKLVFVWAGGIYLLCTRFGCWCCGNSSSSSSNGVWHIMRCDTELNGSGRSFPTDALKRRHVVSAKSFTANVVVVCLHARACFPKMYMCPTTCNIPRKPISSEHRTTRVPCGATQCIIYAYTAGIKRFAPPPQPLPCSCCRTCKRFRQPDDQPASQAVTQPASQPGSQPASQPASRQLVIAYMPTIYHLRDVETILCQRNDHDRAKR